MPLPNFPTRILIPSIAALLIAAALGFSARAQPEATPGRVKEIPDVDVGPSGQTEDVRVYENPGAPYETGAIAFGPFRILPAGTLAKPREAPPEAAVGRVSESRDPAVWAPTRLAATAPEGFEFVTGRGILFDSQVVRVDYEWAGPEGRVSASVAIVPDWRLPIDVYDRFPDSRLKLSAEMIAEHHAIIEEPRAGPAPNVGRVQVYLSSTALPARGIVLTSPDLGQDRLRVIAADVADRLMQGE